MVEKDGVAVLRDGGSKRRLYADALERNAELAKALGELGNLIGSLKGGAVDAVLEAIKSAERIMGGGDIVPMDGKKGE